MWNHWFAHLETQHCLNWSIFHSSLFTGNFIRRWIYPWHIEDGSWLDILWLAHFEGVMKTPFMDLWHMENSYSCIQWIVEPDRRSYNCFKGYNWWSQGILGIFHVWEWYLAWTLVILLYMRPTWRGRSFTWSVLKGRVWIICCNMEIWPQFKLPTIYVHVIYFLVIFNYWSEAIEINKRRHPFQVSLWTTCSSDG